MTARKGYKMYQTINIIINNIREGRTSRELWPMGKWSREYYKAGTKNLKSQEKTFRKTNKREKAKNGNKDYQK